MLSEEEKKAIKLLEDIKNNSWTTKYIMSSDSKNADILLNLITKLQKENEDLLREKEENKFIIAMANNEMLGYNQGYSDAENKNNNATEIVIKNRQAYIHKEEVERYKRKIDLLQKELNEENKRCMVLANNDKFKEQVIDLMAKCIDVELSSARLGALLNKNVKPLETYKEDIKQYFANKVNSSEQN